MFNCLAVKIPSTLRSELIVTTDPSSEIFESTNVGSPTPV